MALASIAALALPGSAVAAARDHGAAVSHFSWCPAVAGHVVQCGTLLRPVVEGRPRLGTTRIAYALVKASDTSRPPAGTVAANLGGPGDAAIAGLNYFVPMLGSLLTDHNLLLVDPRGTGQSGWIHCGLSYAESVATPAQRQRDVARCGQRLGPRAAAYTSAAIVDDIDAVRAKLGIARLDLFGVSYGSYLVGVYAERHPSSIRSIVMSGAYPVSVDPLWRAPATEIPIVLRRLCTRSGACDGQQVVDGLYRLAAQLRQQPIRFHATVHGKRRGFWLGEAWLASLLMNYAPDQAGTDPAHSLWGQIPAAITLAADGRPAALVSLVRQVIEQAVSTNYGKGYSTALHTVISCNDYPTLWSRHAPLPQRRAQYQRALRRARPAAFGPFSVRGWANAIVDAAGNCLGWPDYPGTAPQPATGPFAKVPVLVLSGDLDTNDSPQQGREAAAQFPHGKLLVVPNMGHVPSFDPSGCVASITANFIRTGETGNTSCLASIPPLKVTPAPIRQAGLARR